MKKDKSIYTLNKLIKLIENGVPILIEIDCGTLYTVTEFRSLSKNEDYYDPEDEDYQYRDGTPCNIVAYVNEIPEHIPLSWIKKFFVTKEVEIK